MKKQYLYYDIEIYRNYFLACFKQHGEKNYITFELSETKNEIEKLKDFLRKLNNDTYLIAFNSKHFDDVLLNYILKHEKVSTEALKELSDAIIHEDYESFKEYRSKNAWISVDLFLYWSKMLRLSKKLSLKSLAVAINHPKIQELPYKPEQILTLEQQEEVKTYCYNDVEIVIALTEKLKDKISLRKEYSKKLNNTNMFSYDDIKLGLAVIDFKLRRANFKSIYDYKPDLSIFYKKIKLSSIIFDKIKFQTKEFNKVLDFYKNLEIFPKGDKFNYRFTYNNKTYSLGQGGLHSEESPEIFNNNKEFILTERDVISYYPNLLIRNNLCPPQFPKQFINIYENIYDERAIAKQTGDKLTNETNKLALNGFTGLLKNKFSPACAPIVNLSITINGQLSLLMLIEDANLNGIEVFAANTDGVVFKLKEDQIDLLNEICSKWEKIHDLELEETRYNSFFKRDINNFLAFTDKGKVKSKGIFSVEKPIIDAQDFLIIPKAIQNYFLKGIPIEETLYNEKNIYLFCASFKVAKTYHVIYDRKIQQQLNRFYPSLKGHFLFKKKIDTERNLEHLLTDSPVILFNNYVEHSDIKDYNINYKFFINKCNDIINELSYKEMQLTLF